MPSIGRAASLVPSLLCLGQLAMVDALPQAGDTPCNSNSSTVFTSYQCGPVKFYSSQTYNCTIGSDCPFVVQNHSLTLPRTVKGEIINMANLISSLPSQLGTSILVPDNLYSPDISGNLNNNSVWSSLQAKCPPLSDCGVIVSLPVWNLTGYQIPPECSLPPPNNISFESLFALSGQDQPEVVEVSVSSFPTPVLPKYNGLSCPGTPETDIGTAMVCYLPDSFNKSDPNIPNCPMVPTFNSSDPTASIVGTLSYERSNSSTGN